MINIKKVLFIIGSLQIGGAETVMIDLINNISNEFDITILLIEKRGELLNSVPNNVTLKFLTKQDKDCTNFFEKIFNKVKRSLIYRYLSKNKFYINFIYKKILKENFDTEIAFLAGIPSELILNSPNKKSQKIAWIHASVEKKDTSTYKKYYNIAKHYNIIVGVSEASIKTFEKTFPETKGKIKLIHNFIDTKKIMNKSKENIEFEFSKKTNVISVGRLVDEKGFDRIINIAKKYQEKLSFYIIGDGPLKEKIKSEIEKRNINNVHMLGLKTNPYPYIKKADIFLLSSRSEAYPTVLIEAMILQKNIIATNVAGTEEILEDYENKIIIENKDDSLTNGIDQYLNKKNKKTTNKNIFEEKNNENLKKIIELIK